MTIQSIIILYFLSIFELHTYDKNPIQFCCYETQVASHSKSHSEVCYEIYFAQTLQLRNCKWSGVVQKSNCQKMIFGGLKRSIIRFIIYCVVSIWKLMARFGKLNVINNGIIYPRIQVLNSPKADFEGNVGKALLSRMMLMPCFASSGKRCADK